MLNRSGMARAGSRHRRFQSSQRHSVGMTASVPNNDEWIEGLDVDLTTIDIDEIMRSLLAEYETPKEKAPKKRPYQVTFVENPKPLRCRNCGGLKSKHKCPFPMVTAKRTKKPKTEAKNTEEDQRRRISRDFILKILQIWMARKTTTETPNEQGPGACPSA